LSFKQDLVNTGDKLEALFDNAIIQRDAASGEEKTKMRKVTKNLDKALALVESAEDIALSLNQK
jgi:hypothetical protein